MVSMDRQCVKRKQFELKKYFWQPIVITFLLVVCGITIIDLGTGGIIYPIEAIAIIVIGLVFSVVAAIFCWMGMMK